VEVRAVNTTPHKPWIFVEEEPARAQAALHGPSTRDVDASRESSGHRVWRPRNPLDWAFVPMGVVLFGAILALATRPTSAAALWTGVFLLNFVAVGLLIAHRRKMTTTNGNSEMTGTDEASHAKLRAGGPLQPILHAVEHHTNNIEQRVSEVMEEHAQISLDLSLAHAQKRQVSAVFEALADPVLAVDASEKLIFLNRAAEGLLGIRRGESLRKPLAEVIPHEPIVHAVRESREADGRAARRRHEIEWGERALSVMLSPLYFNEGESPERAAHDGVVAILRDVTKDREAARHKSEFVANAAHELRTPLASIKAYMEMLVDGEVPDEKTRAEYYEIIQTSVGRLGRMIDNILNISRIEAGTVRVEKQPVAISMIVKEAVDTLRPQAEKKHLALTEELAPVVDRILADRDLIHQAIMNLVGNAIKYTPEGGTVQVRMITLPAAKRIRIEVSDTGVGIPKDDLPKMFQKFFRVEANKQIASGTGLGLNLVRQIVETVHGGEVSLESQVGRGSTFAIALPLYQEHTPAEGATP
jgi:two-component system phosphate regulon sensor histidine kinase PhoR